MNADERHAVDTAVHSVISVPLCEAFSRLSAPLRLCASARDLPRSSSTLKRQDER